MEEFIKNTKFSFYKKAFDKAPYKNITLLDAYNYIRGDYAKEQTMQLRAITDKEQARKFKAEQFALATFSGTFSQRRADKLLQHSGLMCFDFDHIADVEGLKQRLIKDPIFETWLAFRSPSGDGLKWVTDVVLGNHTHAEYYRAVQQYLRTEYGVETDRATSSVVSGCFLPFDKNIYINNKLLNYEICI